MVSRYDGTSQWVYVVVCLVDVSGRRAGSVAEFTAFRKEQKYANMTTSSRLLRAKCFQHVISSAVGMDLTELRKRNFLYHRCTGAAFQAVLLHDDDKPNVSSWLSWFSNRFMRSTYQSCNNNISNDYVETEANYMIHEWLNQKYRAVLWRMFQRWPAWDHCAAARRTCMSTSRHVTWRHSAEEIRSTTTTQSVQSRRRQSNAFWPTPCRHMQQRQQRNYCWFRRNCPLISHHRNSTSGW